MIVGLENPKRVFACRWGGSVKDTGRVARESTSAVHARLHDGKIASFVMDDSL